MIITLILSIGLPIGLVIYYYWKDEISLKAVFIGALMFFIFQILIRIPLLEYLQTQTWYQLFAIRNLILTVLLTAFSAALFETVGRYIGLRFILKNCLERKNGIAYGIGHGGIEAILLVGFTYINNVLYSILINTGTTVAISDQLISKLINTPSYLYLFAGIERASTIFFHIAAALIVTYGILNKKKIYILYTILLHFILDGISSVLLVIGFPIWSIVLWVALVGIISFIFIIKSGKLFSYSNHEMEE